MCKFDWFYRTKYRTQNNFNTFVTYFIYLQFRFYTNIDILSLREAQKKGSKHVGVLIVKTLHFNNLHFVGIFLDFNGHLFFLRGVKLPGYGVYLPLHLTRRLESRAIPLLLLCCFMQCSRSNFTFSKLQIAKY
jgi:hypothetical protein